MQPLYNWRYKNLSMSHDQKIMTLLPQWRSTLILSRSYFYCPNLITVVPLSLEIKRFVKVMWLQWNEVTNSWGRVFNGTLWMRFTCCPNLFLASPWLEILKLVILLILSSPKLAAIFLTLGKSKLTLIVSLLTMGRSELFYCLWARS